MNIETSIRVGLVVLIGSTLGQFAMSQELSGQQVTISKSDMEAVMAPAEIEELEQTNRVLEELKAFGLRLERDDPERAEIAAMYNRRIEERNQEFGYLRGLNGQSFMSYGLPPPTAAEIVALIVGQRKLKQGSGVLYPHWERTRDGALVGMTAIPTYETVEGESYPAGDEVRPEIRMEMPEATEDIIADGPNQGADCPFGACD